MSIFKYLQCPAQLKSAGHFFARTIARPALLGVALYIPLPSFALAQDWATWENCTVTTPRIDPTQISPDMLTVLRREAEAVPNGKGNFWRITAPNGQISHLWGIYHSAAPHILALPPQVEHAARNARVATFEYETSFTSRAEWDLAFQISTAINADGNTYDQLLIEPKLRQWLDARMMTLMYGEEAGNWFTPSNLLSVASWDPCEDFRQNTYPTQPGLIAALAASSGVQVMGLQTPVWFTEHIDNPDNWKLASAMIRQATAIMHHPDLNEAELATLVALYLQGENALTNLWTRTLVQSILGADDGLDVWRRVVEFGTTTYFENVLARLSEELHSGNVFAAFGAFVLPGETGIIAQLQNAGFIVERVPLDREDVSQ